MPDALKVQHYPGYAIGPRATADHCEGCGTLIGHGASVVQTSGGWWHHACHKRAVAVARLLSDSVALGAIETLRERGYSSETIAYMMRHQGRGTH